MMPLGMIKDVGQSLRRAWAGTISTNVIGHIQLQGLLMVSPEITSLIEFLVQILGLLIAIMTLAITYPEFKKWLQSFANEEEKSGKNIFVQLLYRFWKKIRNKSSK